MLKDLFQANKKYEEELLLYLQKYRKFIERKSKIMECNIREWLKKATGDEGINDKHKRFYQVVRDNYKNLNFGRINKIKDTVGELQKLDELGVVVVEADKSCGICVVDMETLVNAEEKMKSQNFLRDCHRIKSQKIILLLLTCLLPTVMCFYRI